MSAVQELYHLYNVNPDKFTKNECVILEAYLFTRLCDMLESINNMNNKDFISCLVITSYEKENTMLKENLIGIIIEDILVTKEYDLNGIACYTGIPEEVIYEILIGINHNPSLIIARKIIELHRTIRPKLYQEIMHKIMHEQINVT